MLTIKIQSIDDKTTMDKLTRQKYLQICALFEACLADNFILQELL